MPDRLLAGRYRLESKLGRGGMGQVWRASDELLGRTVAVKEVLLPTDGSAAAERAELCERTVREARAAAALTHPSIITVHDVLDEDDRPWIVMDLVHGRSLEEAIAAEGPMPPVQVARIGLHLLDALLVAHAHGVVHRDVKPPNVLLSSDGRVVLTDFGIATTAGDQRLTVAGGVLGSPGFMAPERLREGDRAGPASDLWSLGATLYAAVEGRAPFSGPDHLATLAAVLTQPPVPPRLAGPLGPILVALLEKYPAARPHPQEVRRVLQAVAAGLPVPAPAGPGWGGAPAPARGSAPVPGPPPPAPVRVRRSRAPLVAAIAAAVLVPGALAGYLVLPRDGGSTPPGPAVTTPPAPAPSSADPSPGAGTGSAGGVSPAAPSPATPAPAVAVPAACSLLTGPQATEVAGDDQGTATGTKECAWSGLKITVRSFTDRPGKPALSAAQDSFTLAQQQARNRAGTDTSDPVASATRSAPEPVGGLGDASFVQDEIIRGPFSTTSSQAVVRVGTVVLTLEETALDATTDVNLLRRRVQQAARYAVANLPR